MHKFTMTRWICDRMLRRLLSLATIVRGRTLSKVVLCFLIWSTHSADATSPQLGFANPKGIVVVASLANNSLLVDWPSAAELAELVRSEIQNELVKPDNDDERARTDVLVRTLQADEFFDGFMSDEEIVFRLEFSGDGVKSVKEYDLPVLSYLLTYDYYDSNQGVLIGQLNDRFALGSVVAHADKGKTLSMLSESLRPHIRLLVSSLRLSASGKRPENPQRSPREPGLFVGVSHLSVSTDWSGENRGLLRKYLVSAGGYFQDETWVEEVVSRMLGAPSTSGQNARNDIAIGGTPENGTAHRSLRLMVDFNDYPAYGAGGDQTIVALAAVLLGPSTSAEAYLSAPGAFLLPRSKAEFERTFRETTERVLNRIVVRLRQAQ